MAMPRCGLRQLRRLFEVLCFGVTLLFVRAAISEAPRLSVNEEQDRPDLVATSG